MPGGIRVKVVNLKEWANKGKKTANSFKTNQVTRQLNIRMGNKFREIMKDNFQAEGAGTPEGRWAPLSPGYQARKSRTAPGKTILRHDDAMFTSLTATGGTNISTGRTRPSGYVFRFGSNDPKLPFHVEGAGNLPRRNPLQVSKAQDLDLSNMMGLIIVNVAIKQGWFDGIRGSKFKTTGFDINTP